MVPYNVSLLSGLGSILDTKKNKLIFRLSLTLSCLSFIGIKYFFVRVKYFTSIGTVIFFKILLIMSFNLCFMQIHVNIALVILVGY